ncbi:MAG: hypothetical protein ACOC0P_02370, partial [Planctomycetota bacterium]
MNSTGSAPRHATPHHTTPHHTASHRTLAQFCLASLRFLRQIAGAASALAIGLIASTSGINITTQSAIAQPGIAGLALPSAMLAGAVGQQSAGGAAGSGSTTSGNAKVGTADDGRNHVSVASPFAQPLLWRNIGTLEFEGGTVGEYIEALFAAAGVEEAPANVIITDEARDHEIPLIRLPEAT